MSAFQLGLRVDGGDILQKLAGDQSSQPGNLSSNTIGNGAAPDYGKLNIALAGIDIDAHSTGNGVYPGVDTNGCMVVENRWLTLTVSVSSGSNGTGGSQFESAKNAGEPIGSNLVGYYFPGNNLTLAPEFPGFTYQEADQTQLGYSGGATADVSSIDYPLAFLVENHPVATMFSQKQTYFFSVTKAWAQNNPAPSFARASIGSSTVDQPPHGADIYGVDWIAGAGWSTPYVYRTYTELGFTAAGDLDAMDVNFAQHRVIYSPANIGAGPVPNREMVVPDSQLMFYQLGATPTILRDGSCENVADKVGIDDAANDDEVDSVCTIDPEMGNGWHTEFGMPVATNPAFGSASMGLSVTRDSSQSGQPGQSVALGSSNLDRLYVQVTGWGAISPTDCIVNLYRYDSAATGGSVPQIDAIKNSVPAVQYRLPTPFPATSFDITEFMIPNLTPVAGIGAWSEVYYYAELTDRHSNVLAASVVSVIYE